MSLRRWEILGLVALLVIVAAIPLSQLQVTDNLDDIQPAPAFVGTSACMECHQHQYDDWWGSDHDLAMDIANDSTVVGDFNDVTYTDRGITSRFYRKDGGYFVRTEGPGGEMGDFEITYVFGHDPLQQYLTPFPGGRLQALHLAWDRLENRWFHLYPDTDIPSDDWLHWTRNAQNWNGMCAECHSTNLQKNYDPETDTYNTTWTDIDVACEACHGPGSAHVAWANVPPMARPELAQSGLAVNTTDLDGTALVGLCAPCHARRAELGDYDHTSIEALDFMLPSLLREGLYYPDGQILDEVYVYGSFLQSKMYARGVRCNDCHDSHSLKLVREGNDLCLQCHEPQVYDTASHHFHKKIHEGQPSDGALCVKCHMVEKPFMVIDWRADHSFRVPRPDLSAAIGAPDACSTCHDDKPLQWSIDAYRKWYGEASKPHYGTAFAAARAGSTTTGPELARLADSPLQPVMVRATALEYLAGQPGPEAGLSLEAALQSDEPLIRHTAVTQLNERDPARLVDLLAPLLSDPVKAVRMAATSRLAGADSTLMKPYQREALARGIDEYVEAMGHAMDFAHAGLNLGNMSANLGRPGEAERYYRQALAIDHLFLPVRMNLAVMLSGQGRLDEAEALLRGTVEAYPDDANAAYSLGLLLIERENPQEGLIWLQKAAEADPRWSRVRYNLGLLLQQSGRMDEAETAFKSALALEPANPDYLYGLTTHYANRGLWGRALAQVDELIRLYPQRPEWPELRGQIEQARRQQR